MTNPTNSISPTLLVVAKAPVAGQAKTRLAATIGDRAAARAAGAALLDTLDAAAGSGFPVVVAMTGDLDAAEHGDAIAAAIAPHRVIEQRGDGFAQRLVHAHADADVGAGIVQIGMDTPQIAAGDLHAAAAALDAHDAALGMAPDGGWWVLSVRSATYARVLADVPMSTSETGALTREALERDGNSVAELRVLADVDEWADAVTVAGAAPRTRFAAEIGNVESTPGGRLD